MMLAYLVLKFLHVIGAAVLLGTGAGIAFFMLMAHRTGDARVIAGVVRIVVIADFVFTASAVVVQPVTGFLLGWLLGFSLWEGWIALSLVLYLVTGIFRSCGCRCGCAISHAERRKTASPCRPSMTACSTPGSRSASRPSPRCSRSSGS
jgi:uncharacterized membrane protein